MSCKVVMLKDGVEELFYNGFNPKAMLSAYEAALLIGDDAWMEVN